MMKAGAYGPGSSPDLFIILIAYIKPELCYHT